jgi:hypothetical protein
MLANWILETAIFSNKVQAQDLRNNSTSAFESTNVNSLQAYFKINSMLSAIAHRFIRTGVAQH